MSKADERVAEFALKLSIIIPVLRESERLPALISFLRGSSPQETEILVVDGTGEAIPERSDGMRWLSSARGRAIQMQAGADAARGEVLLFLHADTRLPPDWFAHLSRAYADPTTVWTAFQLAFDSARPVYRLIAWLTQLRFFLNGVPHGDQAIAVRRSAFQAIGGFPPAPLMEEYLLAERLRPIAPTTLLPAPIFTDPRRYERNGPLRQAFRNTVIVLLYSLGVSPEKLARLYR